MRWLIHHGDLLDVPADVLVCSANVYLTLSGGVGGAYLLRHGPAMQDELNRHLAGRGIRHVSPGDVIETPACGGPYRSVLHAVAVDAFYGTSPEVVAAALTESLRRAAALDARVVALAALGCGYGRMTMADFARALGAVMGRDFAPVEKVVIGLRSAYDVKELRSLMPTSTGA